MKKGTLGSWLEKLIQILLVLLIIYAAWGLLQSFGTHFVESMAVGNSADDLAAAINEVSRCIDEQGSGSMDCMRGVEVKVSVPQNVEIAIRPGCTPPWDPSCGTDPMWVIYHDRKLDSGDAETGCPAAACECHSLWDSGLVAPQCENDLCWGLIENEVPGRSMVDKKALEKLESFYILDPCYAVVRVREDPRTGYEGKIQICYKEALDITSGNFNFCYSDWEAGLGECILNELFTSSPWPEYQVSVWSDDPFNHIYMRCPD